MLNFSNLPFFFKKSVEKSNKSLLVRKKCLSLQLTPKSPGDLYYYIKR